MYFTYFHSIVKYGIILGGSSPQNKITLQKRNVRITVGVKSEFMQKSIHEIRDFTSSM
jgi:hypothetical protein